MNSKHCRLFTTLIIAAIASACSAPPPPSGNADDARTMDPGPPGAGSSERPRALHPGMEFGIAPTAETQPACSPPLTNPNHNHVMPNVKVVGVVWGTNVNPAVSTMTGFFVDVLQSPYLDRLSEFSIPGTTIGRGSFLGMFQITPHNSSTILHDPDFATELTYQIANGHLPPSDSNTLYAVYLPTNVISYDIDTPTTPMGACSGYHYYAGSIIYMIVRDAPACDGTVPPGTFLEQVTSHELIEAITDPYANAWRMYGPGGGSCRPQELGDYCDGYSKFNVPEQGDRSYYLAQGWSNSSNACVTQTKYQSADLLWRNNSYEYVWKVPNGAYYAAAGNPQADTNWTIQGTADINGDAVSDIVWRHGVTGAVNIWFMNNGNTILPGSGVIGGASLSFALRAIADVNGDGVADLIWHNAATGEVYLWLLSHAGTPVAFTSLGYVGAGWVLRGTGDFNHDGRSDLLFSVTSGGAQHIGVWLMNGTTVLNSQMWPTNPVYVQNGGEAAQSTDYSFGGIGDFTYDGISDIVWEDLVYGDVQHWDFISPCSSGSVCVAPYRSFGNAYGYVIGGVGDADGNGTSDLFFMNLATGDVWTWLIIADLVNHPPMPPAVSAVHTGTVSTDYRINGTGFFNLYPAVW